MFSLSFHTPWYIFIASAVAAAILSAFIYRFTVPPVSRPMKSLLISLRSAALTLLVLAISEPLFTIRSSRTVPPALAVLIDNSLSMSLTDAAGNRERQLRELLSRPEFRLLGANSTIDYYSFSTSLRPISPESLNLSGTTTNISAALRELDEKSPHDVNAIILVSDGNYNTGANPLYEAERLRMPLFTVGIGDSSEQRDILIQKVITNSIGYVGSVIPIDATLKVSGFRNQKIVVSFLEEGKQLDQRTVMLDPAQGINAGAEYPLHFSFTPATEGIKKITLRASPLAGEITEKNNTGSAVIKILKSKMRVAVVAGAPSADVSAVAQGLHNDPNVQASLFVQLPNGSFRGQQLRQIGSTVLDSADCIVLIGFPSSESTSPTVAYIADLIVKRSLPLFFISGRTIDLQKLRFLEPFLPIAVSSERTDEQQVFAAIQPQYRVHALMQIEEEPLIWEKLPPIYSSLQTYKAKPEAVMLSTVKIQGVQLNAPLLTLRSAAHMKSFAIAGYGIWRWKLLAGASSESELFFDAWLSRIIRWLVTRDDDKPVQVKPAKEFFTQTEPLDFVGQVYDENYQPIENAELHVTVRSLGSQQQFEFSMTPIGQGRYEGSCESLPEGEYAYTATATHNSIEVGRDQGRFSVGEQSIEFSDTKMNKTLLEQLSSASGGGYVDASRFGDLVRALLSRPFMKPAEQTKSAEFELWNMPLLLSAIIVVFGVEWFLRKRSGML